MVSIYLVVPIDLIIDSLLQESQIFSFHIVLFDLMILLLLGFLLCRFALPHFLLFSLRFFLFVSHKHTRGYKRKVQKKANTRCVLFFFVFFVL